MTPTKSKSQDDRAQASRRAAPGERCRRGRARHRGGAMTTALSPESSMLRIPISRRRPPELGGSRGSPARPERPGALTHRAGSPTLDRGLFPGPARAPGL